MMDPTTVKKALEQTLDDFEIRAYLGMSHISECPRRLYNEMVTRRFKPGKKGLQLCHEGYLHQRDIIARLNTAGFKITNIERELVAEWDDRFRGHIDGEIDGDLLEIKTIGNEVDLGDLWRNGGPFHNHWEQVQCYMRYGGYAAATVVYKTRSEGILWVYEIPRDVACGLRIEQKAKRILAAVDARTPPECECGKCQVVHNHNGDGNENG